MPREMEEHKRETVRKLIREGLSVRDIALKVHVGSGSVQRIKKEMGLTATTGPRHGMGNHLGGRPPNTQLLGKNPTPSPAARRLAEFDPIIRRTIIDFPPTEDDDDG